ncbi:DUF2851 family protein [Desertivirga xinjiangensis]|uniref:DUF2851 family protein n=1 Tax=Desertivirga xinjiangensis TaxID=539206 RepID=UPI00210970C7|nr:DUF2851 family protein [Pedobacter xinjiangensis]
MTFNEDFLHFVWKYRLFNHKELFTDFDEPLEIISPGFHNTHAGADFENVKIRIADTVWVGNVEIHIKSSDWDRHDHTSDESYNNVILHVVYDNDRTVLRSDGTRIVTFVLKEHILPGLEQRYEDLIGNLSWIPCEKILHNVERAHYGSWLARVLVERLEDKSTFVLNLLNECKGSWDDVFYWLLARNLGFKTNAVPFELLARSLPQQILAKHKNSARQIEALVFGQAGFLKNPQDDYSLTLQKEYVHLQRKYQLKPVDMYLWKFMRLRPQNFPSIRLAQFAALIIKSQHLFSRILHMSNSKDIVSIFRDLPVNDYWKKHYRFGKMSEKVCTDLGLDSIHNILLNTVVISLFSYGKYTGDQQLINRALEVLENLPPETNQIINRFKSLGIKTDTAADSQALLQLKKYYCDQKKCVTCAIGAKIIKVV